MPHRHFYGGLKVTIHALKESRWKNNHVSKILIEYRPTIMFFFMQITSKMWRNRGCTHVPQMKSLWSFILVLDRYIWPELLSHIVMSKKVPKIKI